MKVLFIRSGNHGFHPITQNQGDSLVNAGCEIDYFDIKGKGLSGYIKNIPQIRRKTKIYNPDIVHAHYVYSGLLASLSFLGKPIVTSLMGSDINESRKWFIILVRIFTRFFWNASIVKTNSINKIIGGEKVFNIPNGVNLDIFKMIDRNYARSQLSWSQDICNILFGSDPKRKEKNFDLSQNAIELVKKDYPGLALRFLKDIPINYVNMYYNAADVLLLSSINEGSPNVIKEAMACNLPIVSTRVGDVEWIFGEEPGHFVTEHNSNDLATKISQSIEFAEKFGRTNGRQRIISLGLDSESVAKKLISLYTDILEKRSS